MRRYVSTYILNNVQNNRGKLDGIEAIAQKYQGREEILSRKLSRKYGLGLVLRRLGSEDEDSIMRVEDDYISALHFSLDILDKKEREIDICLKVGVVYSMGIPHVLTLDANICNLEGKIPVGLVSDTLVSQITEDNIFLGQLTKYDIKRFCDNFLTIKLC